MHVKDPVQSMSEFRWIMETRKDDDDDDDDDDEVLYSAYISTS